MSGPAKHPAVDAEVKLAAAWYDERCPGLGGQFVDAVRTAMSFIQRSPLRYGIRFADIRRANLVRFPYAVWFSVHGNAVYVLAVLHHKRDFRTILDKRRIGF
jgi:toxin ParE1/3/4